MSKFDMRQSMEKRSSDPIIPEIIEANPKNRDPRRSESGNPKPAKTNANMTNAVIKTALSALEIAKIVVSSEYDIRRVREENDGEIRKIEADIQQIIATANAQVIVEKNANESWHSQFDKKKAMISNLLAHLSQHQEYNDEVKKQIIQLGIASLENK